jgi:chromosome segregation ATPase
LYLQHKEALRAKDTEIESMREKFYATRRELEKTRGEFSLMIQHQQEEIEALRKERLELAAFDNAKLNTSTGGGSTNNSFSMHQQQHHLNIYGNLCTSCRTMALQVKESTHLAEQLKQELKALRSQEETIFQSNEQKKLQFEQSIIGLKAKLAAIEGEKAGWQERITKNQYETEKREGQLRFLKVQREEDESKIDQLTRTIEEMEKKYTSFKNDHFLQLESLKESHRSELQHHQENQEILTNKLREREELLRRLQRETSEIQLRAEAGECELRRMNQQQLQEVKKRLVNLEVEIADVKQNFRLREEEYQRTQEHLMNEKENLFAEINRIKREKDILLLKAREHDNDADSHRKKIFSIQQEYAGKLAGQDRQLRDQKMSLHTMETKLQSVTNKLMELERENHRLIDQKNAVEQRLMEETNREEQLRKEYQHQLQRLEPLFQERIEEIQRELRANISKEKKRAEAYKVKALEAHQRVKVLSEVAIKRGDF